MMNKQMNGKAGMAGANTWNRFLAELTAEDRVRKQKNRRGVDFFTHSSVPALLPLQLDLKLEQR